MNILTTLININVWLASLLFFNPSLAINAPAYEYYWPYQTDIFKVKNKNKIFFNIVKFDYLVP